MSPNEMKENLLQIFEWHWPEFKTEFEGSVMVWRTKSGEGRLHIRLRIPEVYGGYLVRLECDRIIKLSGVAFYGLRRINFCGARLKPEVKEHYRQLFIEKFFLWHWAYKASERFVGEVVDGREVGVLVIHSPEGEENS